MKYNFIKPISRQGTVLEKEKYRKINDLLDVETQYFLYELGLPNFSWFTFDFTNTDDYKVADNLFYIGDNGRKYNNEIASFIAIDLENENEIILKSDNPNSGNLFLGLSLKRFILTLFEFEMFMTEICSKEYFGDRHNLENRKIYIEYLKYRLYQIDEDFFFNDRDYYWGSILEGIETGFIRIV